MSQIFSYLYIDKDGIDSITNQIEEEYVVEKNIESQKATSVRDTFGLDISGIFKKVFSLENEAEIEFEKRGTITKRVLDTYEQKIKRIFIYLDKQSEYYNDVYKIFDNLSNNDRCFFIGRILFNSQYDYRNPDTFRTIYENGYVSVYQRYIVEDKTLSVVMSMNIEKMNGNMRGMTSHFPVFVRCHGGKNIPLDIFGVIRNIDNSIYQIKPYAVWW